MIFEIPGRPIPWQRCRTNNGRYFDSQALQKKNIQVLFKSIYPDFKPLKTALKVEFAFCYLPSQEFLKKHKETNSWLWTPVTKAPDSSNLIKFYEDALNKCLWLDDRFIWSVCGEKYYDVEEKTIINVEET